MEQTTDRSLKYEIEKVIVKTNYYQLKFIFVADYAHCWFEDAKTV